LSVILRANASGFHRGRIPGRRLQKCRESYNAALRAMQLGYRNVLWYRGGLSSWMAAKQQLQPPAAVRGVIN